MARLGFLGLGTMGAAMAIRLVDAGHDLTVWNRSTEACSALVDAGASLASSPAEALAEPITFSMLANDAAAEQVLTLENLHGPKGRVHLNFASISASCADLLEARCAEAGVAYVASPVLGRPPVAAAGELNILAAGPEWAVAEAEPALLVLGKRIWRFGTVPRRANIAKVAVNYSIIHAMQSLAESVSLVEAHGIEARDFVGLLSGSLFGGVVYEGYGSLIAERRYSPTQFSMALGLKDLGLAEELAREGGFALPMAPVLREKFDAAIADEELAGLDWSAMAEVTRATSRVPLRELLVQEWPNGPAPQEL